MGLDEEIARVQGEWRVKEQDEEMVIVLGIWDLRMGRLEDILDLMKQLLQYNEVGIEGPMMGK